MKKGMKKTARAGERPGRTAYQEIEITELFREANGEAGFLQHGADVAHDAEEFGMTKHHFAPCGRAVKRAAKLLGENFRAVGQSKEDNPVLVYREVFPKAEPFHGVGDQGWRFGSDLRRKLLRMLCEEREKRLQGLTHQSKV